jgi:hypothetical protein
MYEQIEEMRKYITSLAIYYLKNARYINHKLSPLILNMKKGGTIDPRYYIGAIYELYLPCRFPLKACSFCSQSIWVGWN